MDAPCDADPASAPPAIWLSVLIPVYNVAPYVGECIASILEQIDGAGIEILLLDDASTDHSRALCEALATANRPLVRLLAHAENRGLSAARNSLLEVARGDYVWFVDSDDRLLPGAIAALRAIVLDVAPDVILCDFDKEPVGRKAGFDGPARQLETDRAELVRGVFAQRCLYVWSKIWRRDLWGDDIRFPVGRCFEDIATVPWILLRARSYYYADEPWIFYRQRADSIVARIARTPGFDRRGNDDLAQALLGYPESLAEALPEATADVHRAIARFCAKEFNKIGKRLLRARLRRDGWRRVADDLRRYRITIEAASPLSLDSVAKEYVRGGQLIRGAVLGLYLAIAREWRKP